MNGSAKRLMAVFAVLAMVVSVSTIVLTDEQDSSADIYTSTYYKDQLVSDLSRNAYIGLHDMIVDSFTDGIDVTLTVDDKNGKTDAELKEYIRTEVAKAVDAVGFDSPEKEYYYRAYETTYDSGYTKVTITPIGFDTITFYGDNKPAVDADIADWIDATESSITTSGTAFEKIKSIHDYVCNTLSYDTVNVKSTDPTISGTIRSVYTALNPDSDHKVVCEGYAKMFKVLCDHYNIPCIIVTGYAGDEDKEAHMWNYVYYNDYWFVVDCTWDDNDSGDPRENYLLAGTGKTIGSLRVADSHDACGISTAYVFGDTFTLPILSALSINSDGTMGDGTQHLVTFMYDGAIFKKSYALDGSTVAHPGEPTMPEIRHFLGWKIEGESDYYDFSTPVTSELTLVADWTEDPVYKLVYDSVGGSKVGDTIVLVAEPTTKITQSVPIKEGHKFLGWNTAKDGTGMWFHADDDITLTSDSYTLYAVWEDTSALSSKVNSLADRAGVFLSEEMIPGVSNLLLTIGVVTALISLLAILAIARK